MSIDSPKVSVKEKLIVFVFLIALLIWSTVIACQDVVGMTGDTALYAQITETIADTGVANGNIFASTMDYIDRNIQGLEVDTRLSNDEYFAPQAEQERDMLRFHFYLVLYLLAPLSKLVSAVHAVTIVQCIASFVCIWFLYLILRNRGCPAWWGLLSVWFVTVHPGWSIAYFGSFYPDRIFMGAGMYLAWACSQKRIPPIHFIIAFSLCVLIGERGALFAGMFVFAYTILYWKEHREYRTARIAASILAVCFSVVLMSFILDNHYYSGGLFKTAKSILTPAAQGRAIKFLLINIVLFGVVSLFEWRAAVIGFAALIPNLILTDIGGAEKLGWSLHYHVFYFVVLIWAVAIGTSTLYQRVKDVRILRMPVAMPCALLIFIQSMLLLFVEPYTTNIIFDKENAKNNFFYNTAITSKWLWVDGVDRYVHSLQTAIPQSIPEGSIVSSIEFGMPYAFEDAKIYIFPMGIQEADYVIAGYSRNTDQSITYFGASTYYGAEETDRFNKEVFRRMFEEYGYDENKAIYLDFGLVIIPRMG